MPQTGNHRTKVLYVITKSSWGGAGRYVYDLATNLPKNQFDVSVIVGGAGLLKEKLETADIPVYSLSALKRDVNPLDDTASFFTLLKLFREIKPDVVHLNSSKIGGIGSLAARIAGVPKIIFTAHGWAFNEPRSPLSKFIIKIIHWITLVLSDKTIAVSKTMADQVAHFPFVQKKIKIVHNGVAPILFQTREEARQTLAQKNQELKEYYATHNNTLWIGTAAELHRIKGQKYLIEAFSALAATYPNTLLILMGEGEERNTLEQLIAEKKLTKRVFLLGQVKDAAIYLKALDIFTLTSLSEAFAYAILEAGQATLPVVASDAGGIPEATGQAALLVTPKNSAAIEGALVKLITNETLRASLGTTLHDRITSEFSLDKMVRETSKYY